MGSVFLGMIVWALVKYVGSVVGIILGENESYIDGTTVGLSLGDTYVVPLGRFVVRANGVISGEDPGIIHGKIQILSIGRA